MLSLNKNYFIIGIGVLLLLSWYIPDEPDTQNNKEKQLISNQNIIKDIEPKKIIEQKTIKKVAKSYKQQKTIKNYQKSHQATQLVKKTIETKDFIEKNIQQQRQIQAKYQYERTQQLKARYARINKERQNYYAMQKLLSLQDPNKLKNRSQIMQNRQMRSYIAKLNYQKRQKQIQEQMKMRSRVVR